MADDGDPADAERAAVVARLGRDPQGEYRVVVGDDDGPVVIENAPLLADGTPMPTRYWLIGPRQVKAVSRLESDGGVRAAEAALDPVAVATAHERYAAARDAALPPGHGGPRPSGGVGGTRQGVKCLHAHYAWFLAGGDDPVGRWVNDQLHRRLDVDITARAITVSHAGVDTSVPVGPDQLLADDLVDVDPPPAAQLTNALGAVADHLDDIVRLHPAVLDASDVTVRGPDAWHLMTVEQGAQPSGTEALLDRIDAEDLFRTLATETRSDRRHNPGLDPEQVDRVVATCCIVVGLMRKLRLDVVRVRPGAAA